MPSNKSKSVFSFFKGWWFSSSDQSYDPLATTSCDRGFEESLEYVIKYINEQEIPFDGLLAFSQGAAFATLLLSRFTSTKYPFRFVIFVANFKSGQRQHQSMYNNLQIDLPNLHVIGTGDRVIPRPMSETITNECFKNAEILRHDGGHFIPTTPDAKLIYIQFLDRFL
jgi:predicted esterase